MNGLQKLFCWFGFHQWDTKGFEERRACIRCGRTFKLSGCGCCARWIEEPRDAASPTSKSP